MVDDPATRPRILVVDDEREVADGYALRLSEDYEVRTAYGGEEALEAVDDDVHVVLLDRRMPGVSGDDVLEAIRDRGLGCRVVMLTAVDPGFGILEMSFDDYLCKPIDREDLLTAIETQLRVLAYELLSEYYRLVAKVTVISGQRPDGELDASEEYADLVARTHDLQDEIAVLIDDFDDLDQSFKAVNRTIGT